MFALIRILVVSFLVGLVTCLLAVGAVGLLTGVPLAFLEILPGDDLTELRQLPRELTLAGFGGFLIGFLGGGASQLCGGRINYVISTIIVATCCLLTIRWTHPGMNVNVDSGILDYLESYRLTLLAGLGSAAGVVVLGLFLKPFRRDSADKDK